LNAADTVKKLAKQYETLMETAGVLQDIGTLEQAHQERIRALEQADRQLEAARTAVQSANADLDVALKNSQTIVANAKDEAGALVAAAKDEAGAIVAKAKEQADKTMAKTKSVVEATIAKANDQIANVRGLLEEANTKLSQANAEIEAKRAELTDLNAAIDAGRRAVSAMIGKGE
jgi:F0F1-type ATP synthase membrane subunit b/b'